MTWLENAAALQREQLKEKLQMPLGALANACAQAWHDRDTLDQILYRHVQHAKRHPCRLLYAFDPQGIQVSSNISSLKIDKQIVGQDLSARPYVSMTPSDGTRLALSDVYLDRQSRRPCMTALFRVENEDILLGYLAADFFLSDLSLGEVDKAQQCEWRQIKGDPSIRNNLFQQTRSLSTMDERLDEVLSIVTQLILEQGIFHAKLHFSSSRASLWHLSDPCRYRIHVLDEIIDPKVCLVYAKTEYPADAVVDKAMVEQVFETFKQLREADEVIYLRAASLNVMNGLVGLNFSCDGSHYMPALEFLNKDSGFWFGHSSAA